MIKNYLFPNIISSNCLIQNQFYTLFYQVTIHEVHDMEAEKNDKNIQDDERKINYNLSILQKIKFKLFGSVKVGYEKHRGWRGELPVYLFRCVYHGLQIAYPSGHQMKLHCPQCLKEKGI